MEPQARPKFLDLTAIRLPLAGVASILHRVSGVGMFLLLPLLVYSLQLAVESPQVLRDCLSAPLVRLLLTGLIWAFLHHFCMGVRILLIDLHIGVEKSQARASARWVMGVSLTLTALLGAKLWGGW